MALTAGARASGGDFQNLAVVTHTPLDSGTVTSTTFTATRTGATSPVGRTFTAPPSGKVLVSWRCAITNSTTAAGLVTFQVKTGTVLGSGTTVQAGADTISTQHLGTSTETSGAMELVEGLTAGSDYNITQMYRVTSASTGTFARNSITITPCIA